MSLLPALSFEDLPKRDPSVRRPKRCLGLPSLVVQRNDGFENMMIDSAIVCTPPLDIESDSGDDDDAEPSMRSPVSSPSLQPVSILIDRKRKDSQEHTSSIHLLDRNQSEHEVGHAPPALDNYGKGAQGRRPTVTFDLETDEPPSPPAKLNARFSLDSNQRSIRFCHHDDDNDDEADENSLSDSDAGDEASTGLQQPLSNPEDRDHVHKAEKAFRRVSISLPVDDADANENAVENTDVLHHPSTSTFVDSDDDATEATKAVISDSNAPQDAILDHVFNGAAPQDMLVALIERSSELKALAARHSEFFNLIYSSLSKAVRDDFKKLLFMPREELSDRDWMDAITDRLSPLPPCILEKFKGIVGWIGPDCEGDENVLWGEDEYGYRDSSFEQVQIKWLRDIEDFTLETFKQCYPQFFINANEQLRGRRMSHGGDQRDQYVIFCETLGLTRTDLPCDNAWARRMNGCLEKHPELLLQLKEIIAYEVGYDD